MAAEYRSQDDDFAELPLDDAVSLIAPNNMGKTSLINALQFLLIIDRRRMDFGAHDFDKTRRFYFPGNSAYILLEVSLPQTGTVVLGCVGKGASHDNEYFAYKGPLNVDDYRTDEGALVSQPQLVSHLASRDRVAFCYSATDFRDLIYGGRKNRGAHEPDFTVFKLEHAGDAKAYQQVLTRTLRLDKLTSNNVKEYLLQIFKRDLPDANINFKQEWDRAFAEVNADRAQYKAALSARDNIQQLEEAYEERLALRGKLIDWRPRIDAGLTHWQAYYEQKMARYLEQENVLKEQQSQVTERDRQLVKEQTELNNKIKDIQTRQAQRDSLDAHFTLVSDRAQLEASLDAVRKQLDQQTTLLGQIKGRDVRDIEQDRNRRAHELKLVTQQLQNPENNLFQRLSDMVPDTQLDSLNRVLSEQVMILPAESFSIESETLQQQLSTTQVDSLNLLGIKIPLAELTPQHQQLSTAELTARLTDLQAQLDSLDGQIAVAKGKYQAEQKKARLEQEQRNCEQDLADYDLLQTLNAQAPALQSELEQTENSFKQTELELLNSEKRLDDLRQQQDVFRQNRQQLESAHSTIERLRHQRIDHQESYSYLSDLPHHPWVGQTEWKLDDLADRLQGYQNDCRQLESLNHRLKNGLSELHTHGLTKYQYADSPDRELKAIIDFSHQLGQEQLALEKKARSAVVNVTASLRELRDGLTAFQGKIREFNRLIGHRQLSDLKTFKIEAEDETHLVEAINTLISAASKVDTGDSYELFNHDSVLDDEQLERAKQVLIDEGNVRQGLRVADLFRLVFIVAKDEQAPETFEDIDSAASNGTVLMAKLVTGLAMLYLMQDKRHQVRGICYLDEALALDAHNQRSLIETARDFGFSLIFASPAPLSTVRYCVPIHHQNGKNHIARDSWQILEPLEHTA
ncbi:MAG: hypothetical protein IBX57_10490 [Gammaproteobacteria bacterium]|nr:hypothetical protein [Gammaproteobacteria bacterium]